MYTGASKVAKVEVLRVQMLCSRKVIQEYELSGNNR